MFLVWPMREDVIGASFLHLINLLPQPAHPLSPSASSWRSRRQPPVLVPIVRAIAVSDDALNPFGAAVMGCGRRKPDGRRHLYQ